MTFACTALTIRCLSPGPGPGRGPGPFGAPCRYIGQRPSSRPCTYLGTNPPSTTVNLARTADNWPTSSGWLAGSNTSSSGGGSSSLGTPRPPSASTAAQLRSQPARHNEALEQIDRTGGLASQWRRNAAAPMGSSLPASHYHTLPSPHDEASPLCGCAYPSPPPILSRIYLSRPASTTSPPTPFAPFAVACRNFRPALPLNRKSRHLRPWALRGLS